MNKALSVDSLPAVEADAARTPQPRPWPSLIAADYEAVQRVLERGVLSGRGAPEMRALEEEFASYIGTAHCLATNSGTAALCLALGAAGIGPGDEVIVPALTYVATAQAVLQCGAKPVFADIDPATFNLDPGCLEPKIGPRTRAIIPVHLHGLPADMQPINDLAARHGLVVIEDAAQAHGALYRGAMAGSLGTMGAFSLNSTKNLPAGEGGLFVTNSAELAHRAARVRFNGLDPDADWDPTHPLDALRDSLATARGSMLLLGEMTAALARSQLRRLGETTERALRNGMRLSARLSGLEGLLVPMVPADRTHVFHKYRLGLDYEKLGGPTAGVMQRDAWVNALSAEGVEVSLWQKAPLPRHPLFEDGEAYPGAQAAVDASLIIGSQSYPLFAQPDAVVDAWADAIEKVWLRRECV